MCTPIAIGIVRSYQSINHTHSDARTRTHTQTQTVRNGCEGLTFFLSAVTSNVPFVSHKKCLSSCDAVAGGLLRGGVVREGGGLGEWIGGGGCPTAVSHQHSVNCSQPVAASQGHSAECGSEECGGQKYLQLEGHPNLFGHIRADPLHPPGRLDPSCSGVMCKSVAKSSLFPTPSGSHYAFSSLFSIFSVPAQLRSAVTLCLRGVQLSWLVTPAPPTCNLRLAVLKSSHSSTGAYISTCSSPLQEQKFAQNGLFSF